MNNTNNNTINSKVLGNINNEPAKWGSILALVGGIFCLVALITTCCLIKYLRNEEIKKKNDDFINRERELVSRNIR